MPSSAIAEWTIALLSTRKRAASIVGDLLELKPQKGTLWFWFSVARVVLALAWRRPVAFFVAFLLGTYAYFGLASMIHNGWSSYGITPLTAVTRAALRTGHSYRYPPYSRTLLLSGLGGAAGTLWMLLLYAAIRFGFRDRVTQLSLALAALATVLVYHPGQTAILITCAALALAALVASLWNDVRRRAALVVLVVMASGAVFGLLQQLLSKRYAIVVWPGQQPPPPRVFWPAFYVFLAALFTTTTICSRTHFWIMGDETTNGQMTNPGMTHDCPADGAKHPESLESNAPQSPS
jgi:hypothetical protein